MLLLREGLHTNKYSLKLLVALIIVIFFTIILDNFGVTVRLFGTTNDGYSTCVHVTGYRPYFYALAPSNFRPEQMDAARNKLNDIAKVII